MGVARILQRGGGGGGTLCQTEGTRVFVSCLLTKGGHGQPRTHPPPSYALVPISTKSDKLQKITKCTVRDPEFRKGRKHTLCSVSANSQANRKNNFMIKRPGSH